jgi:hypothetical protein
VQLFDCIRNIWVKALPEEVVRQKILLNMVEDLGYPKHMIGVEKDIETIPHLKDNKITDNKRRVDIICYAKNINPSFSIYPLLVIECKAISLSSKVVEQVIGYNHHIKAAFISVANKNAIKTMWYDNSKKKYVSVDYLPSYQQLLQAVQNENKKR